jgi:transposase
MPEKVEPSKAVIEAAQEAARKAKTSDELRLALAVLIPCLLNVADRLTAKIIGRTRTTVVRLRKRFRECCTDQSCEDRNWGGRRYGYMTIEQERQFLAQFFEQAAKGGVLVVSEVKKAYEAEVAHKVAKTTIYRMLERHGWRKIMPGPRHPKRSAEAREAFKKSPGNGE